MARNNRLPTVSSPFRFPAGVDYVALRPILVGGVALNKGDHLPADSPLRALPHRIEILCRRRHLSPVMSAPEMAPVAALAVAPMVAPAASELEPLVSQAVGEDLEGLPVSVEVPAAPEPVPAKKAKAVKKTKAVKKVPVVKPQVPDVGAMSLRQLQDYAKAQGLPIAGGRDDLRKRILAAA